MMPPTEAPGVGGHGDRKENGGYQDIRGGHGELLLKGHRVSVGDDEKVLEMEGRHLIGLI